MKYSYENCTICKKDRNPIDFQTYYCNQCDEYYNYSPSSATLIKQKRYDKIIISSGLVLVGLIGATFLFPLSIGDRQTACIIFMVLFGCFNYFKIGSLKMDDPADRSIPQEISKGEFRIKLLKYFKRDKYYIAFYLGSLFLWSSILIYFDSLILLITVPLVLTLAYFPWKRMRDGKRLLRNSWWGL